MRPVGLPFSSAQRPLFLFLLIVRIGILRGPVQGFYYFLEALGGDFVVFRTSVVSEALS